MTPQDARDAMIAAGMLAWDWQDRGDEHLVAAYFDALTAAGFSISLDSVRDHTDCERCSGDGELTQWCTDKRYRTIPCPGGSPVVWAASPETKP